MTRLKLPAYGKQLVAARRGGALVPVVRVHFGDDWAEPHQDVPLLIVRPRDYAPGTLDWSSVVGSMVDILDYSMPEDWQAPVYFLAGEIARFAAVWIVRGDDRMTADCAAFWARQVIFRTTGAPAWPAWWSDEIEAGHAERQSTWFARGLKRAGAAESV